MSKLTVKEATDTSLYFTGTFEEDEESKMYISVGDPETSDATFPISLSELEKIRTELLGHETFNTTYENTSWGTKVEFASDTEDNIEIVLRDKIISRRLFIAKDYEVLEAITDAISAFYNA